MGKLILIKCKKTDRLYLMVAVLTNHFVLTYFGWWRHQPIRKLYPASQGRLCQTLGQ